jgi:hypothetical protein
MTEWSDGMEAFSDSAIIFDVAFPLILLWYSPAKITIAAISLS